MGLFSKTKVIGTNTKKLDVLLLTIAVLNNWIELYVWGTILKGSLNRESYVKLFYFLGPNKKFICQMVEKNPGWHWQWYIKTQLVQWQCLPLQNVGQTFYHVISHSIDVMPSKIVCLYEDKGIKEPRDFGFKRTIKSIGA